MLALVSTEQLTKMKNRATSVMAEPGNPIVALLPKFPEERKNTSDTKERRFQPKTCL